MPEMGSRRPSVKNLLWLGLCGVAVLAPLGTLPWHSRSCLPLAVDSVCVALTGMVVAPFLWQRSLHPDTWMAMWAEEDPEIQRWARRRKIVMGAAVFFFVASAVEIRGWQPGRVNWQMVLSGPGYMLMMWGLMMGAYADARTPRKRGASPRQWMMEGMAPLRSEHWGE